MKKHLPYIILLLLASCRPSAGTFDPMANFAGGDTLALDMDLAEAVTEGIVIPSVRQCGTGLFEFSFDTLSDQPLYYKIYYQNDSYKFPEGDSLDYENFYGSWEDVSIGFKPVPPSGHIRDGFRIVGNPRDERLYYGAAPHNTSPEEILATMKAISADSAWYASICRKALDNGNSVQDQLLLDAEWVIADHAARSCESNNRYKRNPRTGCYTFLLVVCDSAALARLPDPVVHIGATAPDGRYMNPFTYFSRHHRHVSPIRGSRVLKTRAVIDPASGLFVNCNNTRTYEGLIRLSDSLSGEEAYRTALFEQFFPVVSRQYTLRNIPVIDTLQGYTLEQYRANLQRFDSSRLLNTYPVITSDPGSTVSVLSDGLHIVNPASSPDRLRKESTGVRTRIGFTYGRFRGRIKFPPMLNPHGVWNGLTYAFWLLYQDEAPWNHRRPSYHGGYIDKGDERENPERLTSSFYSEIDIEMVKTLPLWPEELSDSSLLERPCDSVVFACTNWDLANPEPRKFFSGLARIRSHGRSCKALRWYPTYKALTIKSPVSSHIFDEEDYCYEIEWRPDEIIWRLGPDPDRLTEVGRMSSLYTSIPNNQMTCVVTQEYHYSEWWPPAPFLQGGIPFSATPIEGVIHQIIIE